MEQFHGRDIDLLFSCEELWTSTVDEHRDTINDTWEHANLKGKEEEGQNTKLPN